MALFRISELADRSGVPSSTLRYYERIGLVEPFGRADNGYRIYDDATLERLAFIGRAKRLGMRLDDVATLVEAWFAGDCEPLQDRLRGFVTGRIAELRLQIAEDSAFERELERILDRLGKSAKVTERCGPDCGCDTDPLHTTGRGAEAAIPCSLGDHDLQQRVSDWRRILGAAIRTTPSALGVRLVFDPSPALIGEVAGLCAAETACCPFFTFNLEIAASTVVLTVGAPAGMEDLIGRLFDVSGLVPPATTPAGQPESSVGPPSAPTSSCACAPAVSRPDGVEPSGAEALAG
jgi:MerR family transcriptional regulator, copper efflux regulator